tara:strand:- start:1971 stop:2141 length:171 start_codon:yes stop_codon:yes gene_type:complete
MIALRSSGAKHFRGLFVQRIVQARRDVSLDLQATEKLFEASLMPTAVVIVIAISWA